MVANPTLPMTGQQLAEFLAALNTGGTIRDLLAALTADDRLAVSAVRGIPAALTFAESRWTFSDFLNNASPLAGAAISSGNITGAQFASTMAATHPGVGIIRSGGSVNGGYRCYSLQDLIGRAGLAFRSVFYLPASPNAGTTIRMGFADNSTDAAPVDGAYAEIIGSALVCWASNNSARTSAGSYTLVSDTWYTLDVDFVTDTSVRFVLSDDAGAVLLDQTISTNVPTTTARVFLAQIIATSSATSTTLMGVDYMGVGPVRPAFVPRPA